MKKIILLIFFTVIVISCGEGILGLDKFGVPVDHTELQHGALHKPNMEYPYAFDWSTNEINCASSRCHHEDLKGGRARVNGKFYSAPSCYQCHGKLWKEIDYLNK